MSHIGVLAQEFRSIFGYEPTLKQLADWNKEKIELMKEPKEPAHHIDEEVEYD